MKLALRTYEKISDRNFFRLSENRIQAFDLYKTNLRRCLESLEDEFPFFSELSLALENDYEITSHDESIKKEFEDFFIKNIYEFKLFLIKTKSLFNKKNIINIFVKHLPKISMTPSEFVDIYILLFYILRKRRGLEEIVEEGPLFGKKTGTGIIKLVIRAFFRWKAGYIPRHYLTEDKWQEFIGGLKDEERKPYKDIIKLEEEFYRFKEDHDYLLFLSILTNPVTWALRDVGGIEATAYGDRLIKGIHTRGMEIEMLNKEEDRRRRLSTLFEGNKEILYKRLIERSDALFIGRETIEEFFNYIKANIA